MFFVFIFTPAATRIFDDMTAGQADLISLIMYTLDKPHPPLSNVTLLNPLKIAKMSRNLANVFVAHRIL